MDPGGAAGAGLEAVITGASSQIGDFLQPRLLTAGIPVIGVSRNPPADPHKASAWHRMDLMAEDCDWDFTPPRWVLFHLAPLSLLIPHLPAMAAAGMVRLVAFSSTSLFSKTDSSDDRERRLAMELARCEQQLADYCGGHGIAWTIFRPTMIYGAGKDSNISLIAKFVKHFHFFPLVGSGIGLRQPVHADDLAAACLSVRSNAHTYGRIYELSGGERLSYRDMVERVFRGLGMSPRFLPVPAGLLRLGLRFLGLLPGNTHFSAAMVDRINRNLCFDSSAAVNDFGFAPRSFSYADSEPA